MIDIIKKTRDDYNAIAHHFSTTRYDVWPDLEQFKPFIKPGQRILDWGCGNGRLLLLIQAALKFHKELSTFEYYGTDQSNKLLQIGRAKWSNLEKKGLVKFYSTALGEKKFPPNFFDLVFLVASFHHLPTADARIKLLTELYKQTKTGGNLFMTVWNLGSEWSKKKQRTDWNIIGPQDFLIPWKNPRGEIECERYYHHFTIPELKRLVRQAGFTIEKIGYYGKNVWTSKKGGRNLVVIAKKE